jgi:hypothetical protein
VRSRSGAWAQDSASLRIRECTCATTSLDSGSVSREPEAAGDSAHWTVRPAPHYTDVKWSQPVAPA